jgi:sesquipedalian
MKRTISLQISQLSKEGWLQKRGQVNKTWKKRYFILKNVILLLLTFSKDILFYFLDNKDSLHPLGLIYLKNARIEKDPKDKDSTKYSFILHSDKSYYLQANNSEEKYFWISSLEFRISNLQSL